MALQYHSQAGQDRFVDEMFGGPVKDHHGSFLEIGCCEPMKLSNTYYLEQCGWRGYMFDLDMEAVSLCRAVRKSIVIYADTTIYDWTSLPQKHFDYLSLDVDSATLKTLQGVLEAGIDFRVATIEHDSYRFGTIPRDTMRGLLLGAGYVLYLANVASQGEPFEDWWVHPSLRNRKINLNFVETAPETP